MKYHESYLLPAPPHAKIHLHVLHHWVGVRGAHTLNTDLHRLWMQSSLWVGLLPLWLPWKNYLKIADFFFPFFFLCGFLSGYHAAQCFWSRLQVLRSIGSALDHGVRRERAREMRQASSVYRVPLNVGLQSKSLKNALWRTVVPNSCHLVWVNREYIYRSAIWSSLVST